MLTYFEVNLGVGAILVQRDGLHYYDAVPGLKSFPYAVEAYRTAFNDLRNAAPINEHTLGMALWPNPMHPLVLINPYIN